MSLKRAQRTVPCVPLIFSFSPVPVVLYEYEAILLPWVYSILLSLEIDELGVKGWVVHTLFYQHKEPPPVHFFGINNSS